MKLLCFTFAQNEKKNTMEILTRKRWTKIFSCKGKPFLSDKIVSKEQIIFIEIDKIFLEDSDVAQYLTSFFSSFVTNLNPLSANPTKWSNKQT